MLLPEAGAIYVVDRGYPVAPLVDTLPAFMCCTKPGPSSSRVPSRTSMLIASIRRRLGDHNNILDRHHLRPDHLLANDGFYTRQDGYPELLPRIRFKDVARVRQDAGTSSPTTSRFQPFPPFCVALLKAAGKVELFFKWRLNAASSDINAVLRHVGWWNAVKTSRSGLPSIVQVLYSVTHEGILRTQFSTTKCKAAA